MEALALAPLTSLETALASLITSLTTTNTFALAPSASKDLLSADSALTSALVTLHQHQQNNARILSLRAEATHLESQLKSVVTECVDLRSQLGGIHPSILSDSDSEDEVGEQETEIDYMSLLSFAARIGKHNSLAALEASNAYSQSNTTTAETRAEVSDLDALVAAQRAQMGMPFPAGEVLRLGALGRLQVLREREGEEAVEREAEVGVKGSENVAAEEIAEEEGLDLRMEDAVDSQEALLEESSMGMKPKGSQPQSQRQGSRSSGAPAPARRKLDLDFPGSDDFGDDD